MQQPAAPRLNPRQADAAERRQRMTQRRQDLTQKVRKQKKSAYLAQKRQLGTVGPAGREDATLGGSGGGEAVGAAFASSSAAVATAAGHNGSDPIAFFRPRILALCQQQCSSSPTISSIESTLRQLQEFQTALLGVGGGYGGATLSNTQRNSDQRPLIILSGSDADEQLAVDFLKLLLEWNVWAWSGPSQMYPLQQQQQLNGFVTLLLLTILKILAHLSSFFRSHHQGFQGDYYGRLPITWSELLVKTTTSTSPATSNTAGNLPSEKSWPYMLYQILTLVASKDGTTFLEGVSLSCLVLGNVVGEGNTTTKEIPTPLKQDIIRMLIATISFSLHATLSSSSNPTPEQTNLPSTAAWALTNLIRNDSTSYACRNVTDQLLSDAPFLEHWLQQPVIATQTAWMTASLTSREGEVPKYLSGTLVSFLISCLQRPKAPGQSVPVLQALGNLASHSSLVPVLLLTTTIPFNGNTGPTTNLVSVLQQMLKDVPSRDPNLIPTLWLTGCLLVDTGVPDHPSTTLAAPALAPVLMDRLGSSGGMGGGGTLTLEEEREMASALWNALEQPPDLFGEWSTDVPFVLAIPKSTCEVLIRLMKSSDDDAVLASVHVLDLYLRRVGGSSMRSLSSFQDFMQTLEEEDAVQALEAVCDSHVEDAAEVAANLIDDFFAELCEDDGNDMGDISPNGQGNIFASIPPVDDNAFAMAGGTDAALSSFSNDGGMGRGRGATLPSWMTNR